MCKIVSPRTALAIAAALGLSGCVTLPPNHVRSPQDPWESWNRGVYRVNDKLDRAVALPRDQGLCDARALAHPYRREQLLLERHYADRDGKRCLAGQVQERRAAISGDFS